MRILFAALAFAIASLTSSGSQADDLRILCASGMREVVSELQSHFERESGRTVTVAYGEAGDLRKRIHEGEAVDVVVLPRIVLDQVLAQADVVPGTIVDVAQSAIGIGIRKDTPRPDISTAEGLKKAFLDAKSIATTDPASGGVAGVHVADVFRRLGIAEELKPKLKLTRGQRNAQFVATGEADVAIQLSNEIRMVPGIEFIPFPKEFERTFVFSAALASHAHDVTAAQAVLRFLAGSEVMTVIRAKGMDPAGK